VYVLNPNNHKNEIILSVTRALEENDWLQAEELRKTGAVQEARISGFNKGGLIVRFGGLRGFVPTSQMASTRRPPADKTPDDHYGAMVNQPIMIKVMEVDREKNRLILSERTATRESREKRKEELIQQLNIGEVREGTVVSLEDFGAFVEIGGAEGLVHVTEISWKHINHPQDVLRKGQKVRVEVISVDPVNKRIGLSIRRQESDPWQTVLNTIREGQLVKAEVTKIIRFGVFARLVDLPAIEGLVHISELSDKRVTFPKEVVNEGEILTLRVIKIDNDERRLGLSLKRVTASEYLDSDWPTDEPG
jgi:small subunit ribosomal protein S1